ncbi:peptidylprolyl isomerase [Ruegeria arenilitoris]|uniref:peptidylprolyl isomerase n=1 Tax=Ruegeria arenilitoris TaxID=1173585 RepID=UPI00147DB894|nr:peptidylprolyl isomerase [Ruegeria arenilitoris]
MRVIKEPLFHFILIGIAIFGWFNWVSPQSEGDDNGEKIAINEVDVDLLSTRFEASWKRAPSEAELEALIDALVREEVLVREARKLGLDKGDQVIRARLAQKMEFLTTAIASSVDPDEAELQAYLEDNAERFMTPSLVAFDQVFLGETAEPSEVAEVLSALNSGEDWSQLGVPSLLLQTMPLSALSVVDSAFGRGFSGNLTDLEMSIWSGPIQSGYGQHLVRVTGIQAGGLPSLDDIREAVLSEWRRETGDDLAQAQYEILAAQYEIQTPTGEGDDQ